MRKSKIRKNVTRIIAGVAIVALVIVNLQVGINDQSVTDLSSLSDLSISLFTPAAAATGGGGPGSNIVTCYSSTGYCNWWNSCWDTYKCGPCSSIRTDRTGDRGTCEYGSGG